MVSSALLPVWGWQSVFYLGGIFPFILSLFLIFLLPESVQFLSQRGSNPEKIAMLLGPIAPETAAYGPALSFAVAAEEHKGVPVKFLFKEGRTAGTILLWIPNFMNLLLMYVILNWLPELLRAAGMSGTGGVTATAFFSLGGILGTLAEGFLIKIGGAFKILFAEFGFCGLLVALMSRETDSWRMTVLLAFLLGFLVIGAQAGLNVLAAKFYPTFVRSTGVGWALGIGRIGSIIGPLFAGILRNREWEPQQILLTGAVPALLAFCAILAGRLKSLRNNPYSTLSENK